MCETLVYFTRTCLFFWHPSRSVVSDPGIFYQNCFFCPPSSVSDPGIFYQLFFFGITTVQLRQTWVYFTRTFYFFGILAVQLHHSLVYFARTFFCILAVQLSQTLVYLPELVCFLWHPRSPVVSDLDIFTRMHFFFGYLAVQLCQTLVYLPELLCFLWHPSCIRPWFISPKIVFYLTILFGGILEFFLARWHGWRGIRKSELR